MKHFSLTVLLVTLLVSAQIASGQNDATTRTIMQLENGLNEAILKADTAALEKLIANEWFAKASDTSLVTKTQLIDFMKSNGSPWASIKDQDVNVRAYDSAVVVEGISTRGLKGSESLLRLRFTRVYARSSNGWQLVAMHHERITQP
jgi:hypothetical protein